MKSGRLKSLWRWVWLLPGLVMAAGCVKVEQTITLQADGSGVMALSYGVAEETAGQMNALAASLAEGAEGAAGSPAGFMNFSDEDLRRELQAYEPYGVRLVSLRSERREGWKYRHLVVRFQSLERLARTELMADRRLALVKDARGRYILTQSAGPGAATLPAGAGTDAVTARLMQGFHATLRIKTPGRIVDTNAGQRDAYLATWDFDLAKDPLALEKAQRLALRIVFEGRGLNLTEFRKP